MCAFTRGQDPKISMGIGVSGRIATVLKAMFEDYKNGREINHLKEKYGEMLTQAYFRKIIGSGVIARMTQSKRDMFYKWNGGDNPDFKELTDRVMSFSHNKKPQKKKVDKTEYTTKLTILLYKNGVSEDKIPTLIEDIKNVFKIE